ncbi:PilN domain-containing protein [Flagellimonas onchidii]|uniref:PilN domain-containing protein n=1 Tax=Flagellimonas onchidii TaxID=2562684 RepID=UPI00197AD1F5|nr:PilN domain-containing protein [Allomuricauda onchidii]
MKNIDIFGSKTFAVIRVVFGDAIKYHVLELEKDKEQLSVKKSFAANDFDQIQKEVKTDTQIILNFSGRGVVSKKVSTKGNYIKEVLFNGNPDDFYSYTLFQDAHNFISICRKETVDGQFAIFKDAKYQVVDYSIGPFVAHIGKGMVNGDVLQLDGEQLVFRNTDLMDYARVGHELDSPTYLVGDDRLSGNEVVLLSSLLSHLYPSDSIDYDADYLFANLKEQKQKRIFEYASVGALALFLLALMGSYLLLQHYNKKYVEYEEQLYHFNDNYAQLKKMEEDVINKRFIVENSGVLNKNFISFYVNEVVKTVPEGITLNGLQVNPLLKKVKGNETISMDFNTLLINGRTSNSFFLNQWVKRLRKNPWVRKIEILNLNKVDGNSDAFSLKIDIE